MLFTAVTLHNIPEGMAVGLAFALAADGEGLAAAAALAFGIGVQNFPEGAAVSLPLRQLGMGRGRAFLWGAASGAVMALGLACPFTDAADGEARMRARKAAAAFNRAFKEKYGCLRCVDLKRAGHPCDELIEFAAEQAEAMLKENK